MRLDLQLHHNISRLTTSSFIAFAMDSILFTLRCTFINFDLDLLGLLLQLFSLAVLALLAGVNAFSDSSALVARACSLGVHSWTYLHHYCSHSLSFAAFAGRDCL